MNKVEAILMLARKCNAVRVDGKYVFEGGILIEPLLNQNSSVCLTLKFPDECDFETIHFTEGEFLTALGNNGKFILFDSHKQLRILEFLEFKVMKLSETC